MRYLLVLFSLTFMFCDFGIANSYDDGFSDFQRTDLPREFTQRMDSIPDYYQRDKAFGGFIGGGSMYCAPTSVSNVLMYLNKRGYDILGSKVLTDQTQYDLIKQLGSPKYFNTGTKGTGPAQVCRSLKEFFEDKGINNVKIHHLGWRSVSNEFKASGQVVDLESIRRALLTNDAVLLNYGWYRFDPEKNEYIRTGGHWVTLVGYGFDGKETDSSTIIVHDPETRKTRSDYVKLQQLETGKLKGPLKGLPRNAKNHLGFKLSSRSYGVIDGAVFIKMPSLVNSSPLVLK